MKYTYQYIYGRTMSAYDKLIEVLWSIESGDQIDVFLKMVRNFGQMTSFYKSKLFDNFFSCSNLLTLTAKKELEKYDELVKEMTNGLADETDLKLEEMKNTKDIITAPPAKIKIQGFKWYEE